MSSQVRRHAHVRISAGRVPAGFIRLFLTTESTESLSVEFDHCPGPTLRVGRCTPWSGGKARNPWNSKGFRILLSRHSRACIAAEGAPGIGRQSPLCSLCPLEYQDKPGSPSKLKGAYLANTAQQVADQACRGVIRATRPWEANTRAAAKANPNRPRYTK